MKKLLCLVILSTSFAFAQVKYDFFTYFGKFPAIPKSAAVAYSTAQCGGGSPPSCGDVGGNGKADTCNLDKFFGSLRKEIEKWNKELVNAAASSAGTGMEDLMKKAQEDPEAMEKMSEADKQKMAQQMMAQAMKQQGPRKIEESPEVMDATRVYAEVNSRISQEKRSDDEFLKYKMDHQTRIAKRLAEIDDQYQKTMEAAEKAGNDAAINAACRAAIQKKGQQTTALIVQEYPSLLDEWEKEVALWKARLAPLADPLRKANYGIDAKDPSVKKALGDAQSLIFGTFQKLLGNEAAVWGQGAETYGLGKRAAEMK